MRRFLLGLTLWLAASSMALADSAAEVFNRVSPSVGIVLVYSDDGLRLLGSGSAVAVGLQTMVTNRHVLLPNSRFTVLINGAKLDALPGTCDNTQDLCLLSVPGFAGDAVEFGSLDNLKVGHDVYAVGAPNAIMNALAVRAYTKQTNNSSNQVTLNLSLTQGTVSALLPVEDGAVIQTNAQINPGSSGGGLFDSKGRLVGITTFGFRNMQGIGMALPIEWVKRLGVSGWRPPVGSDNFRTQARPAADSSPTPAPLQVVAAASGDNASPSLPSQDKPTAGSKLKLPFPWWWLLVPAAILLLVIKRWLFSSEAAEVMIVPNAPVPPRNTLDERFVGMAKAEFESPQKDAALWLQLLREKNGNEEVARQSYIRRRAQVFAQAEKERLWAEAVKQSKP